MKLKAQLVKREIAGDTILVPVGETTTKLQGLLTINETGAAIWDALPEAEQLEISNSLRYVRQYCEMPLKILKAEQLVGGEEAMDRILRGLFNRELDPMYPYLTYQDFLNACGLTEEDLNLA